MDKKEVERDNKNSLNIWLTLQFAFVYYSPKIEYINRLNLQTERISGNVKNQIIKQFI